MKNFLDQNKIVSKVIIAIFVPKDTGASVHSQRKSHGVAFNLEGEKDYIFSDGSIYNVKKNDIIYLPKGSSYRVKTKISGGVFCINFDWDENESFSPFVITPLAVNEVLKAYQTAERAWASAVIGKEYIALSSLYKILYEIKRQDVMPYLPQNKKNLLNPAIDYIHKHYVEELIDVKKLSDICCISYDYLRKLFKRFYGVSPIKYINGLKINRAKELLSSGFYSVSEVALSSGFSDLSHFSRFFKQNVGVLPSEYVGNKKA